MGKKKKEQREWSRIVPENFHGVFFFPPQANFIWGEMELTGVVLLIATQFANKGSKSRTMRIEEVAIRFSHIRFLKKNPVCCCLRHSTF